MTKSGGDREIFLGVGEFELNKSDDALHILLGVINSDDAMGSFPQVADFEMTKSDAVMGDFAEWANLELPNSS